MPTEQNKPYPQISQDATLRLESFLTQSIKENGNMSFAEYMQHALYHPDLGYYTNGHHNVGKSGDFFTSVSVGQCFGIILAHRIHQIWLNSNTPAPFHIIEIGANNGQLALDILNQIQTTFPKLYKNIHYHIIEHLPSIQNLQKQKLSQHTAKTTIHSSSKTISGKYGIILSNELIDAFPVHLLQLENNIWHEKTITLKNQTLTFHLNKNLPKALKTFTTSLPPVEQLPNHYQTEYRPGIDNHIAEITTTLEHPHTITIDYGYTHSSYYTPARKTGTLRCYHQHQADENPLIHPGLKDITAHVDFTQLAKSFIKHQQKITSFATQAHYLTKHAKQWLLSLENNINQNTLQLIKQFQTLTHPTIMGHQFHILETSHTGTHSKEALEKLEIEIQTEACGNKQEPR